MSTRSPERTPVIGEVWFRRGKVIDSGTDAQRLAWAQAAPPGDALTCQIVRHHDRKGVPHVDFTWTQEVPVPTPAHLKPGIGERHWRATKLIPGTYSLPLERFLLEWEPMTRERT